MLHVKARSPHPLYPPRLAVPDQLVPWTEKYPTYNPVDYTADVVKKNDRFQFRPWPRSQCLTWYLAQNRES